MIGAQSAERPTSYSLLCLTTGLLPVFLPLLALLCQTPRKPTVAETSARLRRVQERARQRTEKIKWRRTGARAHQRAPLRRWAWISSIERTRQPRQNGQADSEVLAPRLCQTRAQP